MQVLDFGLQQQLKPLMKDMKPLPSIYYPDFIAANQVYALRLCSLACYLTNLLTNCCLLTYRLLLTRYQLTNSLTY